MTRAALAALVLAPAALAQGPDPKAALQPPPVAAAPAGPVDPAVAAHLNAWEAKHRTLTNLQCEVECKKVDKLKERSRVYTGQVMCMKPNLAWMNLKSQTDPNLFTAYISDGTTVFEYDGAEKTVIENRIPKANPNGIGDNLLIEFMSGTMTAAQAMWRFDIKLDRVETHYIHLMIYPRLQKDQAEFSKVRLVLFSDALKPKGWEYVPAAAVVTNANGQLEEQWTFKDPKSNIPGMKPEMFKFKEPGPGWTRKLGPTAGADPKVARPQAPAGK